MVALDILLKKHGSLHTGPIIIPNLTLADHEFADDATLTNMDTKTASNRLTHLNAKAIEVAGMGILFRKRRCSTPGKDLD